MADPAANAAPTDDEFPTWLTPSAPTAGQLAAGTVRPDQSSLPKPKAPEESQSTPTESFPVVPVHPAPDGRGMTNLSDEDFVKFNAGQKPPAAPRTAPDEPSPDWLTPSAPTAGQLAAGTVNPDGTVPAKVKKTEPPLARPPDNAPPMPNPVAIDPNSGLPYFDPNTPEGRYWNKGINEGQTRGLEKIGEGATVGLLPYAVAGARTLAGTPFRQGLQEARDYTAKTSEMAPGASQVLEGIGGLIPTVATFGAVNPLEAAAVRAATPAIGAAARYVVPPLVQGVTGGALGAASAAGHDVGMGTTDNIGSDMWDAAKVNAAIGAAGPPLGELAQAGWNVAKRVGNWVGQKGIYVPGTRQGYTDVNGGTVKATPQQQQVVANKLGAAVNPTDAEAGQNAVLDKLQQPEQTPIYDAQGNVTGYQSAAPGSAIPEYQRTLAQQTEMPAVKRIDTAYRTSGRYPQFDYNRHRQEGVLFRQLHDLPGATGNPASVGEFFRGKLNELDANQRAATAPLAESVQNQVAGLAREATPTESGLEMQNAINQQQAGRQNIADQITEQAREQRDRALAATPAGKQAVPGGGTVPEEHGAEARGQVLTSRKATTDQEDALWRAINPDGQAGAHSVLFKDRVQSVYDEMPKSAKPPSGEEANILKTIKNWPDMIPLTELQAVRTRLGDAITEEITRSGSTTTDTARRMIAAKHGLDSALEDTLDAHAEIERLKVQAGDMSPDDTLESRLGEFTVPSLRVQKATADWLDAKANDPKVADTANGSQTWTQLTQPSDSGLRPYTEEEIARLRGARDFSRQRAQTYDEGVAGEITAPGEHRTTAQVAPDISRVKGGFGVADAEVMDKLWNGKVTEASNLRAAKDAGITPDLLKAYAADDLRAAAVDANGNFDPAKWQQWSRTHAGGLHIFPEVQRAFEDVATAQTTLAARQAESEAVAASHPLRGIEQPSQIPGKYVVKGDTGADMVRQYIKDSGGDAAAMQAFDDSLVRKMLETKGLVQTPSMGVSTLDAEKLAGFRSTFKGALSQRYQLAKKLGDVESAQAEFDRVLGDYNAQKLAMQNGAAKNFLDDDPAVAIRKAFSSSNPAKTFSELVASVRGTDAEAGLKRGVADYLVEKFRSARPASETEDFLKSGQLRAWIEQHHDALVSIGGGQWLNVMQQIASELRRNAYISETAVGSQTAQRLFTQQHAGPATSGEHRGPNILWAFLGEALAGKAGLALAWAGPIRRAIQQSGLKTMDDLMAAMLMDHTVGRALLTKVVGSRPTPIQVKQAVVALTRFANSIAMSGSPPKAQ